MRNVRLDGAQSQIRATGSRALALALITGIDQCEQEGHPLTQVQQTDLATMAIMAYSQILEGEGLLAVQATLDQIHG